MKKLFKVLGIVVGVVFAIGIAGAIFGGKPNKVAVASSDNAGSYTQAAKPIATTALGLFAAYEKNEVAADQRYKGKTLAVGGTVQSIDKDAFDNIVVKLRSGNDFMSVDAYLNKEHESLAASLSKGQKVSLVCEGGGRMIGSPILRECAPA